MAIEGKTLKEKKKPTSEPGFSFGLGDARPYLKCMSGNLNKVLRPREKYSKSIFCCKWQLVQTLITFSKVES